MACSSSVTSLLNLKVWKYDEDGLWLPISLSPSFIAIIHSHCFKEHKSITYRTSKSQMFPYLQSDASFGLLCCCQAACTSGPCWQVKKVLMNLLAPLFFYCIIIFIVFFLRGQVSVARAGCSPSVIAAHVPPSCWGPGSGRAVSDTGAGEKQQRQKDIPSYLSPGDESAPRLIPTLFKNKPTYFC